MAWLAGDAPRNVTLFPYLALMSVLDEGQSCYCRTNQKEKGRKEQLIEVPK